MRQLAVAVLLVIPFSLAAQEIDSSDISSYHQNIFLRMFFPRGIAEGVALRSYIRSDAWERYRKSLSDPEAMDEIYLDAEQLCSGRKTPALLAASIAVLEHKTIPVKLLFGAVLEVPLTLENQNDFSTRIEKLPAHIYSSAIADKDKLQHFFFSAFFMRAMKMKSLVRLLGNSVEIGEDLFVVGGVDDVRDRHANEDGIGFGESGENTLPSSCLTPNP